MIGSDAVDSCHEIDNQMAHSHHYCPTTPTGQSLAMDRERMREFTIRELIEREASDVIASMTNRRRTEHKCPARQIP
jgi:hypothetical protein